MNTKKLSEAEMAPLKIAALPTRPTAPTAYGGKGYSSIQMKEAFDKLPELIAARFNELINDITSGEICDAIPVDSSAAPNLKALLNGLEDGTAADAIRIGGISLTATIAAIKEDIITLTAAIEELYR